MGQVKFIDKEKFKDSGLPDKNTGRAVDWNELKYANNDNDNRISLLESNITDEPNTLKEYGFNWVENFDWYVFAQSYVFDSILYENFVSDTVTIDPAPTTVDFKRFDVIVFNNDFTFSVIKGIEGLNPGIPNYDIATQLEVTVVLVQYGETEPTGVNKGVIYKENVGLPNEYNVTEDGGGKINLTSTEKPETGTYSIKVTNADVFSEIKLDKEQYLTASDIDSLLISIFNVDIRDNGIYVYLYNSIDGYYQSTVQIKDGRFGYNKDNFTSWQKLNIPFSKFGANDTYKFTGIAIRFKASIQSNLFIDNIEFQGGFTQPIPPTDEHVKSTSEISNDGSYLEDNKQYIEANFTSATNGQVPTWNGSEFVMATPSGGGSVISRITNPTVTGTYNLDHSLASDWKLTLTGDTTITESNLPTGTDTLEFTIKITGDFALTVPSYWDVVGDTYDGTIWNFYAVQIHNGVNPNEEATVFLSNL